MVAGKQRPLSLRKEKRRLQGSRGRGRGEGSEAWPKVQQDTTKKRDIDIGGFRRTIVFEGIDQPILEGMREIGQVMEEAEGLGVLLFPLTHLRGPPLLPLMLLMRLML